MVYLLPVQPLGFGLSLGLDYQVLTLCGAGEPGRPGACMRSPWGSPSSRVWPGNVTSDCGGSSDTITQSWPRRKPAAMRMRTNVWGDQPQVHHLHCHPIPFSDPACSQSSDE
jgi:hypothetical protein